MIQKTAYLLLLLIVSVAVSAQQYAVLKGKVINEEGQPVSNVNIFTLDTQYVTVTNNAGHFKMNIPANKKLSIRASHLEYIPFQKEVFAQEGETVDLDITLKVYMHEINTVKIEDFSDRVNSVTRIDVQSDFLIHRITSPPCPEGLSTLPRARRARTRRTSRSR